MAKSKLVSVFLPPGVQAKLYEVLGNCPRMVEEARPYGDGVRVSFDVWAKDESHAVKIANERRVQLIASGQWEADWEAWRRGKGS
jgi:hypothetical protein